MNTIKRDEAHDDLILNCIERHDHLNLKGLLLVIDYLGELHGVETPDIKELFANKELELELA